MYLGLLLHSIFESVFVFSVLFYFQLIQPCSELFVLCRFGSTVVGCAKVIRQVKADTGFCCSLNYIPAPDEHSYK